MNVRVGNIHIRDILFRYADEMILDDGSGTVMIKGFLYRKRTGNDSRYYKNGRTDRDDEFCLVADCNHIKKGDKVIRSGKTFFIAEVSPLCITDHEAGITARAVMLRS